MIYQRLSSYFETEYLSEVIPAKLYRCERRDHQGRIYQILYIDTSDDWLMAADPFINELAIDAYYAVPGHLQWNHYYYFIADRATISLHGSQKRRIESNVEYARKAVLPESELFAQLRATADVKNPAEGTVSSDLYTVWVAYLKDNGFSFIFNETRFPNYNPHVENYIKGIPFADFLDSEIVIPAAISSSFGVTKLEIDSYRTYPLNRRYDFGRVNLIHGPNAAGKTSLLDCFELTLTGANFQKSTEDNYRLTLTDSLDNSYTFPDQQDPYKSRDAEWYHSFVAKGNNLNGNFNKFNYFNSDAAFKLKLDDDLKKNDLMQVMSDIALGQEVNILEERIVGFRKRFDESYQMLDHEIIRLNEELSSKNTIINDLKAKKADSKPLFDHFRSALNENGWLLSHDALAENLLFSFTETLEVLELSFEQISQSNYHLYPLTQNSVFKELNKMRELGAKLNDLHDEHAGQQKLLVKLGDALQQQQVIYEYLEELGSYFNHPNFKDFESISSTIKNRTANLELAKAIEDIRRGADLEREFADALSLPIRKLIRQCASALDECKTDLNTLEKKVSELEIGIGNIERMIVELRSLGKIFAEHDHYNGNCPICHTPHSAQELLKAIMSSEGLLIDSQKLITTRAEKTHKANQLTSLSLRLDRARMIEQLALLVYEDRLGKQSLSDLFSDLRRRQVSMSDELSTLLNLNTIQAKFNNDGLDPVRYRFLLNKVNDYFKVVDLTRDYKQSLSEFQKLLIGQTKAYQSEQNKASAFKEQMRNLLGRIENEDILHKNIFLLQGVFSNIKKIGQYIDLAGDPDITELNERFKNVKGSFQALQQVLVAKQETAATERIVNMQIDALVEEARHLTARRERARKAAESLQNLMEKHNKYRFLGKYIEANKKDLVNIFRLIHSPLEFSDIEFNEDRIALRSSSGIKNLNQISTGQRSALALSVFLGLNKKLTSGPNLILLDDPLTYIDDLNVLSFFDYLRELVIGSDKQVFFATANDDIAYLFRKKFEFLGPDEFKVVELSRAD